MSTPITEAGIGIRRGLEGLRRDAAALARAPQAAPLARDRLEALVDLARQRTLVEASVAALRRVDEALATLLAPAGR
ncbi:hypothetical protein [Inmirania thermothiophila]|uniref:Uncharacterized protein n=1 Tax=Inmirania thermothiophila TaxID=1750597 RepID=A0A3N1Y1P2_9GAMM|nr:hypothetical protein [Inmirania thermothiophila]ROR32730.1 hypothetical protein EDC57_1941 [Inmirania thermothiophila]